MAETVSHIPQPEDRTTRAPCVAKVKHRSLTLTLTLIGASLGLCSLLPHAPALIWNFTESVPVGLYAVDHRPPAKGDIVVVAPAEYPGAVLHAYDALPANRVLLKQLAAVPGDTVCRHTTMVTINGVIAAVARLSTHDGRALPAWSGCRALLPGDVFLLAPHPASFDSRYFGAVDGSQIVGVAHPIFTLPPSQERL